MQIRDLLLEKFGADIFQRPLFYSYPNGLRFELSEGRTWIGQFLSSHSKAMDISSDVFAGCDQFLLCLRSRIVASAFNSRNLLRQLQEAQIPTSAQRAFWSEPAEKEEWEEGSVEAWEVTLAFWVPAGLIQNVLWCALANDLGVSPRLECAAYLVNLQEGLAMYPYDDRGMDIVGPNTEALRGLYNKHHSWLLSYDLPAMQAAYGAL